AHPASDLERPDALARQEDHPCSLHEHEGDSLSAREQLQLAVDRARHADALRSGPGRHADRIESPRRVFTPANPDRTSGRGYYINYTHPRSSSETIPLINSSIESATRTGGSSGGSMATKNTLPSSLMQ